MGGHRGWSRGWHYETAQTGDLCTQQPPEVLLAGVSRCREIHLGNQCAPEGILKGVDPKGEFHEIIKSASQVLLAGVSPTGEIHLENQCASEGIVEGVRL